MENPLTKFYLSVIFVFGTAGVLTFMPGAAAPFFSFMWKTIISLTLCAMGGWVLLILCRYLFFR